MLATAYVACFLLGLGLALLRGALALFGVDSHADVEVDADVSAGADAGGDMPGVGMLNLTVFSVFLTVFGGVGALMHYTLEAPALFSMPIALGAAGGVAYAMAAILRKIFANTQADSAPVSNRGLTAEVTTPIPAGGLGEIAYLSKGARFTAPARALHGGAIERAAAVVIVDNAGAICIVQKR